MFLSIGLYNKFCEVSRSEALFCLEFPEGPQPPSLFFSGIAHLPIEQIFVCQEQWGHNYKYTIKRGRVTSDDFLCKCSHIATKREMPRDWFFGVHNKHRRQLPFLNYYNISSQLCQVSQIFMIYTVQSYPSRAPGELRIMPVTFFYLKNHMCPLYLHFHFE